MPKNAYALNPFSVTRLAFGVRRLAREHRDSGLIIIG
jgi:hypothetical protein